MEYELKVKFDSLDSVKTFVHIDDLMTANIEARSIIRNRLKYQDNEDDVVELLEYLRDTLYIEGLE